LFEQSAAGAQDQLDSISLRIHKPRSIFQQRRTLFFAQLFLSFFLLLESQVFDFDLFFPAIVVFQQAIEDNTCLLSATKQNYQVYSGRVPPSSEDVLKFINRVCKTHRTLLGGLTKEVRKS
jgi:hypothetical protein